VRWVEQTAELREVVAGIGGGPLAVDTEADSFHHYREKVCLIQLSFGRSDVLVDTLSGVDLSVLGGVLADDGVRKILHGADYDVRMLRRDCGLTIRGLFDTMVAARLVGERAFGLSALLDKHLGVRHDKRHQRADWSRRPLPPELVSYAVLDTRHLATVAGMLESRLASLGREAWAEEEFRRVERVRWDEDRREGEIWLRVKGVRALDRRQMAVARELADLRERTARARDVPPFRILRDEVMLELIRAGTEGRLRPLAGMRGLPREWRGGSGARALQAAIERGLRIPAEACPKPPPQERRARPSREAERRLRRLCRERDRIAARVGLEPAVLAPRALLESVAAQVDRGRPLEDLPDLRRWQQSLLGPVIDAVRG
jgi:ribonuclease D